MFWFIRRYLFAKFPLFLNHRKILKSELSNMCSITDILIRVSTFWEYFQLFFVSIRNFSDLESETALLFTFFYCLFWISKNRLSMGYSVKLSPIKRSRKSKVDITSEFGDKKWMAMKESLILKFFLLLKTCTTLKYHKTSPTLSAQNRIVNYFHKISNLR